MATPSDIPAGAAARGPERRRSVEAVGRRRAQELADYLAEVAGYTAAGGGDEDVQRVVIAIGRIDKRLDGFYRDQLDDLDLHPGDWAVLKALAFSAPDGSSTPSQLAAAAGVSPSTMTHRLDLMAQRELVDRTVDPENRTRSRVRLTRTGRALFSRAVRDAEEVESSLLAGLTPTERAELAKLLEKLLAGQVPD